MFKLAVTSMEPTHPPLCCLTQATFVCLLTTRQHESIQSSHVQLSLINNASAGAILTKDRLIHSTDFNVRKLYLKPRTASLLR